MPSSSQADRIWLANPLAVYTGASQSAEAGVLIQGNQIIELIAASGSPAAGYDQKIDLSGKVLLPGLINTHHHFYQTLTRALPAALNKNLFPWLKTLYPVWARLDRESHRAATRLALAELLLSGCTTASDHHYLFSQDIPDAIDHQFEIATEMGVRVVLTRGSMSLGEEQGGLPPQSVVQTEEAILDDSERLIKQYHQTDFGAMQQIALAPCSPFSVTEGLMREAAQLARAKGVLLHTHLAETLDEEKFCIERTGKRPLDYAEALGWIGDDVWFAHGVHFNPDEIRRLGETRTGIAHCPVSNMRLASGIAPIPALVDAGARVGIAVDGSASNDSGNLLREAQATLFVHRLRGGAGAMGATRALRIATRGGAEVLGRDDVGSIVRGQRADLALYRLDDVGFAGARHDPVAALLFCCGQMRADTVVVDGKVVVDGGRLVTADVDEIAREGDRHSRALLGHCAE